MADIPGIIEGAHEGKGLGTRFLRHIERNAVLLFVVPCDSPDIGEEYLTLLNELEKFNPSLLEKSRILGISKCDMTDKELLGELKKEISARKRRKTARLKDVPIVFFSSVSHFGIPDLIETLWKEINRQEYN
jgi:GTP-binding protein